MPEWAWGVLTPLTVVFVGWLFRRAMDSMVDERIIPIADSIRKEMVSMNGKNTMAQAAIHSRISATNERVASLEASRRGQ